jgi:aldose 1-epimerase
MYLALLVQWFNKTRNRLWHAALMRSGALTVIFITVVVAGLAFGWHEHRLGQFAHLKQELKQRPPVPADTTTQPGGKAPIVLQRSQLPGENGPEFLSATLLPGRGMNVLQITAFVPQRGEIPLLASPSMEQATQLLNGIGADDMGGKSLAMGGAIELPWAGGIAGAVSADRKNLSTMWHGHHLNLPIREAGEMATGGLMLKLASDSDTNNVMPDGGEAQSTFKPGNFEGRWPSQTEVTTTFELNSRNIEITVVARNSGDEPEPMGIGWQPRFVIPGGDRSRVSLRLPATEREEILDRHSGIPTGRLLPVQKTAYDFTAQSGALLGSLSLNDTFVHLRQKFMDNGPIVELRDPGSNYGLRMTMLSPGIRTVHVVSPAGANYVQINPQFNYDDPFGHEWDKEGDTGIVTLQPGQSVQWRIRLEIFSLNDDASQSPQV